MRATEGVNAVSTRVLALTLRAALLLGEVVVATAQGRQTQAGLYPNPLVGYQLEDQTTRTPNQIR